MPSIRGRSAEEIERLVTIPLEVALSGMPGLKYMRSKSLFGLSYVNTQFEYGFDYLAARQEVINRMTIADLPHGRDAADLAPLADRRDLALRRDRPEGRARQQHLFAQRSAVACNTGRSSASFAAFPALPTWSAWAGPSSATKCSPTPTGMKRYGITLDQLQTAIAASNDNVSGDYLVQGRSAAVVRGLGLFGRGRDPVQRTLAMNSANEAVEYLRARGAAALRQIRQVVLTTTNNLPIRVDDIVEGGPLKPGEEDSTQGVVVSNQTRLGKVALSRPEEGRTWRGSSTTQGQHDLGSTRMKSSRAWCCLRKGAESLPALKLVDAKIEELNNTPGRLPPGVQDRALLRSHRPDQRHDRDGRRKPARRHRAGDRHPADVPQQRPQRDHHCAQSAAGAAVRLRGAVRPRTNRPTCFRSAPSTSASSSTRR